MKRISLGLPEATLATLDAERGSVPRERWIRDLIEAVLSDAVGGAANPYVATDLAEQGRQLASQRDDLIAQGVPPAKLEVPIAPVSHPKVGLGKRCARCGEVHE